MNLLLEATREVTVNKTGKIAVETCAFSLWQTPTKVTDAALENTNPKAVYIAWCKEDSQDVTESFYADSHIKELEEWIKECEDEGYEIEWSAI